MATPYTLMDDGDRLNLEFGAEIPLRGNGPFSGYGYFLVVGYGYGIDAPRHHGFGRHDNDAQVEFKR